MTATLGGGERCTCGIAVAKADRLCTEPDCPYRSSVLEGGEGDEEDDRR